MNRNAKMAIGFTLAALLVTAATAHAQNTVRVRQSGGSKNVAVMMQDGGGYSYSSGQGEGMGQSNAQKDDLFAGTEQFEKNATEVSEITMDPDSLDMVRGPQAANAHSMLLNTVKTYEYDKPGMYDVAAVNKFREKLNMGDWHCTIHTRELKTGESTDVCYKHRTDGYREEAIITVEPKELTFIHRIKRANGPGHSDMSGLPMVWGDGAYPQIAQLNSSILRAEMAASMAEMRALNPGFYALQSRLYDLQKVQPFDTKDLEKLKDKFKDFKIEMPNLPQVMPAIPASPAVPATPAEPKPEE